ncbi:MAG: GlsB/YeaQ/YmgE family stress response membrane protein [Aliidongia sp.]
MLGIVGALVAGYLERALHIFGPFHQVGFIGAVIGAVIVLAIWHCSAGRNTSNAAAIP